MGSINLGMDFESIHKDRVFFRVLARHWPAKIVIFTWEEVEEAELWLEAQRSTTPKSWPSRRRLSPKPFRPSNTSSRPITTWWRCCPNEFTLGHSTSWKPTRSESICGKATTPGPGRPGTGFMGLTETDLQLFR